MSSEKTDVPQQPRPWWTGMWGDVQFWVPFVVLLLGLLLLCFVR